MSERKRMTDDEIAEMREVAEAVLRVDDTPWVPWAERTIELLSELEAERRRFDAVSLATPRWEVSDVE